jgi:hypothetical protein
MSHVHVKTPVNQTSNDKQVYSKDEPSGWFCCLLIILTLIFLHAPKHSCVKTQEK